MELRTGNENFTCGEKSLDFTLLDFWQFQFSNIYDLQEHIAEFLVAKALGINDPHNRSGWTLWDVDYRGLRIEVKETGYYYSWQKEDDTHDHPRSWDIHKTFVLDANGNRIPEDNGYVMARQNDVYVFCLNTGKNEISSNPLQLEHWEFYIVETKLIDEKCRDNKSISLGRVRKLTNKVTFSEIKQIIDKIIASKH